MKARSCQVCGAALSDRGRGRTSVYCSAACRQRAYRLRHTTADQSAADVLAEIERQVRTLALRPPQSFRTDADALATTVRRLRRLAQNVTPEPVTKSAAEEQPPQLAGEPGFAALVEPHRKWLHLHCYRMAGSYDDAEDLVQETLLKAWRDRSGFEGRAAARTWLYRIATNVCIDHLRRTGRRPQRYESTATSGAAEPPERMAWLQPYPDQLLDEAVAEDEHPEAAAVSRETMELVFLATLQHLPPRQRAVLIFRDVLGRPAEETATLMDMSVAAANSALQRARQTLRERLPQRRTDWTRGDHSRQEQEIVRRYMAAAERSDVSMMADLLSADVLVTMPPNPVWFAGRDALLTQIGPLFDRTSPGYFGRWRHLPVGANRLPAVAGYVQRPGTSVFRAQMVDVLRIEAGQIMEITTFEAHLVAAFGLPLTLPMTDRPGARPTL
ncbi:RNA polymerase, sigma-24 subunit, ECF subfamily [Catenulispora acidiphila DSM 44928]|uniref:RNA polymerase sigma factor n=1 Tax=Catenulispora acidiphila (strain DSM 44928 / JCM 14897 / NBRC 102108 / NRRL B-24433 / ID139908) TaxID=479433 RepID=C7PVJ0_CATAD|nr:sigma-70 family RNA polymerase sigma factor [Catenulispora acidiphila]ACU69346.1 RNA polymerase, sigma-24 subunit, ECF subfamily [Catenulispora acidiphila DSM 44928]